MLNLKFSMTINLGKAAGTSATVNHSFSYFYYEMRGKGLLLYPRGFKETEEYFLV